MKRMSGMEGTALPVIRKFEETITSHEDLVEKLALIEDKLTADEKDFLAALRTNPHKKSLARLIAEAGVSPTKVLKYYAEGAVALGKVHAAIAISREQPGIVKDLVRNALDDHRICKVCVGTGKVKRNSNDKKEETMCPNCEGAGTKIFSSKHKTYAMDKVLELGGLVEAGKGSSVNVAVQQNVAVKTGGGAFMERILKTSDEILYGRPQKRLEQSSVVDVEAKASVLPEDRSGEPS